MTTHKIQWLNLPGYKGETWNPVVGCNKISDGCKNCYAEKMALRLMHMPHTDYYQFVLDNNGKDDPEEFRNIARWNGTTHLAKSQLTKPATWKAPRVVFVCSMGDLFHETVSFETINAMFSIMADCDRHIFIVLTKRPEQMVEFYRWKRKHHGIPWQPSDNVWMGVSAENQEQVETRVPVLNKLKAAVKIVSVEPMLGPIDIRLWFYTGFDEPPYDDVINWVICGGESGHNARPMHPDWVRSLRDQCNHSEVPFFFKQWGEWMPVTQMPKEWGHPAEVKVTHSWVNRDDGKDTGEGAGEMIIKVGKHQSGNLLDGVKYEQYPGD